MVLLGSDPVESCQYTVSVIVNIVALSIKSFMSTDDDNMRGVDGKLYVDAQLYLDYYGNIEFTNEFMMAALTGTATSFENGNLDFIDTGSAGRDST
jgi:hypothetical protein